MQPGMGVEGGSGRDEANTAGTRAHKNGGMS